MKKKKNKLTQKQLEVKLKELAAKPKRNPVALSAHKRKAGAHKEKKISEIEIDMWLNYDDFEDDE